MVVADKKEPRIYYNICSVDILIVGGDPRRSLVDCRNDGLPDLPTTTIL